MLLPVRPPILGERHPRMRVCVGCLAGALAMGSFCCIPPFEEEPVRPCRLARHFRMGLRSPVDHGEVVGAA